MNHNHYERAEGRPPPQPHYASQQQYSDYYSRGYPYSSYQQKEHLPSQQQKAVMYGSSYPAPPVPPNDERVEAPPIPPPPPPDVEPAPPGTADESKEPAKKENSVSGQGYSESRTASSSTATASSTGSCDQAAANYSTSYWPTPTSTAAQWGNPSTNWPYSSWYPAGQSQEQGQQTYSNATGYTAQQYNYAQYSNAGGSGHGWSQSTQQSQGWGWGGQQHYQQYQPNQWGSQQWGGATHPGSEAWAGGWSQQQPNYQGSYYGQPQTQQYRQDGNYQGYPQDGGAPQTPQQQRRSRSPGTPPLQELLSPGAVGNENANDRGTPSSRKHQSSSNEGEPDSKRPRQDLQSHDQQRQSHDQQRQSHDQQRQSHDQQRQSHELYPPMKKILLSTPPPSQNNIGPMDKSNRSLPPPSSPIPMQTAKEGDAPDHTPSARGKFPPGFSSYVNRAFAACLTGEEREKVHEYLDEELNKVFNESKQWDIDWDNFPLPRFLLRNKKPASRWDTPSPSKELMTRDSPIAPAMGGVDNMESGDDANMLPVAFGRGRGKRKKKGKKGKNKFFIDNKPAFTLTPEDKQKMSLRTQRFGKRGSDGNKNISKKLSINDLLKSAYVGGSEEGMVAWQDQTLEGTSQSLEKQYLRLTSAPDPSTVRPLSMLRRAYDHVLSKWEGSGDYRYTCEQFKSIRQDLTLQKIRNEFAVLVYETHARIALRKGDRGEFNQCQTQLKALYHEGAPGNQAEFIAYRILYLILTDNTAEISSMLKEMTSDLRHSPCVDHALRVHYSWFTNNYRQFFKLYRTAPNLSGALIDMFVERERQAALKTMAKAYRPSLPVWFITQELEFNTTDDCVAFLTGVGVVLDPAHQVMDCKLTVPKLS